MQKLFIFIILLFVLFSCSKTNENQQPNIIIILTDDQGWGDLSINGNTNISTPNIDKLAENGVTFDRFYVCPVCSPTRAELLTGRYHVRSGVWETGAGGERMDLDETTIAEVFKEAGYATAAYGKWHNGMQAPYHPNSRGFDDYYGFCSGHWGNYYSPMLEHNGEIVQGKGFIIDDLTNHGIEFIKKNKDNPFFLYLPYNTPHSPMQVPDEWWDNFKDKNLEMYNREPEKEDTLFTKAALAMCENIDWNVGRIVKQVEESGLLENTIIMYLSDNGPNGIRWNGGMKGKKGSTDEGGVRSPLFVQWQGTLGKGKVVNEIAAGIDFLPTLAEIAGIEINSEKPLDGKSLTPLLFEDSPQWADRSIYSHWHGRVSARNQKFRLDNKNQLFDMENDPGQFINVAEEFPDVYKKMVAEKEKWEQEVLSELEFGKLQPFTVGAPDFDFTQLPARDGIAHGNIIRSNRWPNSSYYLNWISTKDSITWNVEVLTEGTYEVELYYTCAEKNIGSEIELKFKNERLQYKILEAFDPPLLDDDDIYPRGEGYVKPFKKVKMGNLKLSKDTGTLTLKANTIPGTQVMDFRLLMLKRI